MDNLIPNYFTSKKQEKKWKFNTTRKIDYQIDAVNENTDYIFLSIGGGNNFGFSELATNCLIRFQFQEGNCLQKKVKAYPTFGLVNESDPAELKSYATEMTMQEYAEGEVGSS
ncbi:MAG: hypothetical protein LBP35_00740 [Candidatus Ancillula trichonymphae]|nr:hypothetical protein [Candidatus Ancillula trichonymphae]